MKHSKLIITAITCMTLVLTVLFSGCGKNTDTDGVTITSPEASVSDTAGNGANASNGDPYVLEDVPTKNPNLPS